MNLDYVKSLKIHTIIPLKMRRWKLWNERNNGKGDRILPKLFTSCIKSISQKMNWEGRWVNIKKRRIKHLWFADNILLILESSEEFQEMLIEINRKSIHLSFRMYKNKTKLMFSCNISKTTIIENEDLDEGQEYNY